MNLGERARAAAFGQRKVTPRVCIADNKTHLRTFLADVLEDLGFITCECAKVSELAAVLDAQLPDLVVLGLSFDGIDAGRMLDILAAKGFAGKVLAIGAARIDPGQGDPAAWRRARHRHAAAAAAAVQRRHAAGEHRGVSSGRTAAKSRRRRRRGAEGRLAGIVVPAEDRCPHPGPLAARRRWCGCAIRPGVWFRRPTSSRTGTTRTFAGCRNS